MQIVSIGKFYFLLIYPRKRALNFMQTVSIENFNVVCWKCFPECKALKSTCCYICINSYSFSAAVPILIKTLKMLDK